MIATEDVQYTAQNTRTLKTFCTNLKHAPLRLKPYETDNTCMTVCVDRTSSIIYSVKNIFLTVEYLLSIDYSFVER